MENQERSNEREHTIDISTAEPPSSATSDPVDPTRHENRLPSGRRANRTRYSPVLTRSPLNSGFWISVEIVVTIGQILSSVILLIVSKNEHPCTQLFVWIVGYSAGCVAALPALCWRYIHRDQPRQSSSNGNAGVQNDDRLKALFEYYQFGLDCFFAVWFVLGNIWVFRARVSLNDSPNLYSLCIAFLVISCIGYAMPFILCATMCCWLPCIVAVMRYQEGLDLTRGATTESINALPMYRFKLKRSRVGDGGGGGDVAGVIAAGTDKERVILGEDAVCCICLGRYANNEELRELPCTHLFHKDCVDKWLKINARCPLCKTRVRDTSSAASQRRAETRVTANNTTQLTET